MAHGSGDARCGPAAAAAALRATADAAGAGGDGGAASRQRLTCRSAAAADRVARPAPQTKQRSSQGVVARTGADSPSAWRGLAPEERAARRGSGEGHGDSGTMQQLSSAEREGRESVSREPLGSEVCDGSKEIACAGDSGSGCEPLGATGDEVRESKLAGEVSIGAEVTEHCCEVMACVLPLVSGSLIEIFLSSNSYDSSGTALIAKSDMVDNRKPGVPKLIDRDAHFRTVTSSEDALVGPQGGSGSCWFDSDAEIDNNLSLFFESELYIFCCFSSLTSMDREIERESRDLSRLFIVTVNLCTVSEDRIIYIRRNFKDENSIRNMHIAQSV
jgi:hypothetical protein